MKQFQLLTASYSTDYLYTYLEGVVEEISSVFFIELARSRELVIMEGLMKDMIITEVNISSIKGSLINMVTGIPKHLFQTMKMKA